MSRDQRKYIKDRLYELYREKRAPIWNEAVMPPEITQASKIVERWRESDRKRSRKLHALLSDAYVKAKEALLFADSAKALEELRRFEQFKVTK